MIRTLVSTVILVSVCCAPVAVAQEQLPSRVDLTWNRLYDYEQMTDALRDLTLAYPDLLTMRSLGQSEQGREMWLVILNNPETGPHDEKPAIYIDGNIHGNEVQCTEVVMYSIWYLTKSYGQVEPLTELVDRASFYFVPSVNPDSRAHWFREANTPHAQRSGQRRTDNDRDGAFDEDGPEDLDGDGHITRMYRFDPEGRFRRSAADPRIIERVPQDEMPGELTPVGSEGIDNDGDGRINEDGPGGYDMNRNWPGGWQPSYIQRGAGDHPFSFPETKAVGEFILAHPNIAAAQSYHNTGGMILRGPGAPHRENLYPRSDRAVYDKLGQAGEEMLPFYNYWIIHEDLYTVHGGTVNWTGEQLGIVSFTNELWTNNRILQDTDKSLDAAAMMRFRDRLQFGQTFTDYSEYDHPTLGKVLIGGTTKYASRVAPPFMLEEEAHRNFAFTMYHAEQMPLLSFDRVAMKELGRGLWEVTVTVKNDRIIPSRTAVAAQNRIGLPDVLTVEGAGVVASGEVNDRFDKTIDQPTKHTPATIRLERGIPSEGQRMFRFLLTGNAGDAFDLRYTAQKARDIERRVVLGEGEE